VPDEAFAPFRKKAVQKLSNQVNIPGFRKGHVPEQKLIEQFGEQAILAEAAEAAIPDILTKAIVQENVSPITRPDVQLKSLTPFSFTATITVFPEIKMGNWESAGVPKKEVVIKKKEIDEVIEQLRERFIERKPVDRAAKKDDFVEVNFSGKTPDGVPLDGTESKCHPLVLGSGQFIPGFEDELIGMKKDEEKSFTITFPKDYGAKHMAGKPVVFDVKMLSVAEQVKPEVDEAFTEKVFGKKMTVAEMETEIETMLKEKGEDEERARRENELIQKWEDLAEVDMPRSDCGRGAQKPHSGDAESGANGWR
jgi:trigger factor